MSHSQPAGARRSGWKAASDRSRTRFVFHGQACGRHALGMTCDTSLLNLEGIESGNLDCLQGLLGPIVSTGERFHTVLILSWNHDEIDMSFKGTVCSTNGLWTPEAVLSPGWYKAKCELERGGWTKGRTGVGMVRRKQLECRCWNIRVKVSESTGYS